METSERSSQKIWKTGKLQFKSLGKIYDGGYYENSEQLKAIFTK